MSWRDELLRRFPRLEALPADAYVVGGAIRDLLLERDPADVDVACLDARACAERIGKRVIRLGTEEHLSAWRVVEGGHVYDVAGLLDGAIGPDLGRRDFTVNAMAVRLGEGELIDHHGGQRDLHDRTIRMIDASNFDDDPLRCLKAVRMALVLRFEIEPATLSAIRDRAPKITAVAAERVSYELSVILSAGQFRRAVALLHATRLAEPLFGRSLESAVFATDDVPLAGALALLVTNPSDYGRRWKWGVALRRDVAALQRLLLLDGDRRVELYEAGEPVASQLPLLLRAVGRDDRVEMPDFSIRPLLTGEEIGELALLDPGPRVGEIKKALLEAQIRGDVVTCDDAVAFVSRSARGR